MDVNTIENKMKDESKDNSALEAQQHDPLKYEKEQGVNDEDISILKINKNSKDTQNESLLQTNVQKTLNKTLTNDLELSSLTIVELKAEVRTEIKKFQRIRTEKENILEKNKHKYNELKRDLNGLKSALQYCQMFSENIEWKIINDYEDELIDWSSWITGTSNIVMHKNPYKRTELSESNLITTNYSNSKDFKNKLSLTPNVYKLINRALKDSKDGPYKGLILKLIELSTTSSAKLSTLRNHWFNLSEKESEDKKNRFGRIAWAIFNVIIWK